MRQLLIALTLLPLYACGADTPESEALKSEAPPQTLADVQPSASASEHAVTCGCVLEEVRHCSEWIDLEGEWVELELPLDLGSMPFCGKQGLRAKVDGQVEGEAFVATSFAYVD